MSHVFLLSKDRDGFLDRRTDGLKAYLEKLAVQVQTTAQDPILEQLPGLKPNHAIKDHL